MKITIELPDAIAHQLGDQPETVVRRLLEDATVENYRTARLSQRQAAVMLGFDYWQVEKFLREHGALLNYSAADLEKDASALYKIFGSK
jgi:tRNA(Ile)-lysidine synthase TilS/MesJ